MHQTVKRAVATRTTMRSEPAGVPAVDLRHVSKRFGETLALRDVNLAVAQGEVVALLGPNGAGKTTALAIMLGLREPSSGDVALLGEPPRDLRARSRCGAMLQESGVPLTLTVRELVELFRAYYPAPLPAERAIALAGLIEKADARAGTLSGGQRQRLYFALALCGNPDVLFLDEPTAGLDVEARRDLWAQLGDFVAAGKTIVLTTHYLEEADAMADRIVVIDHGRVIADAPPAQIKTRVAGKRIGFDLVPPEPDDLFAGLPVEALERSAHHATFLTNDAEGVLRTLFARGAHLQNLEVAGAGLEEAFLSLTQEGGK